MALSPPPPNPHDLRDFPRPRPPISPGRPRLFRIFLHRDPASGRVRRPFHFVSSAATSDAAGGRYDLPEPDGACYLALKTIGAWLEVFRSTVIVASDDVRRRRLLITRPPRRIRTADLGARGARRFGVTGDIHTHGDYALTRAWAGRLYEAGFRALLGKVRHDPGLRERSLTLLDRNGEHEPYGWRWHKKIELLHEADDLLLAMRAYGFKVLEVPHDVPIDDVRP